MNGYINGKAFEASEFGYDGCHKIYLCDSEEGKRKLEEYGYDFFPIEDLPDIWTSTCPLRFIQSGDLSVGYVGQGIPAEFVGWDLSPETEQAIELMNGEIEDVWEW